MRYLPISARTVGLYCYNGPHFSLDVASFTSQSAAAIVWDDSEDDNEPLGSGRPFSEM